jgi:hypothetical protein
MDQTFILIFIFIVGPVIAVLTALFILLDELTGKVGQAAEKAEKEKQDEY